MLHLTWILLVQDVSEDTDDMFDDLLKKHGKVVYRRNDQKPATEEVDDDAESLSCMLLWIVGVIKMITFRVAKAAWTSIVLLFMLLKQPESLRI